MHKSAWQQIESFYTLPTVDESVVSHFRQLKNSQSTHTRDEENLLHYCTFFLPYHANSHSIYLGHHKKANDWIPPGGHIDLGETPTDTTIREMQEELDHIITSDQLTPFSLSVKPINRPEQGCLAHYDVWYLVRMQEKPQFQYDPGEYYNADWFSLDEGIGKIQHNPDFAKVISRLDMLS